MVWVIKHIDEYIPSYEEYYKIFLTSYRERVKQYYNEDYEKNPDYFSLMTNVRITILFRTGEFYAFFTKSTSDKDEYITFKSFFANDEEEDEYRNLPPHIKKQKFNELLRELKIDNYFESETHWYGMEDDPHPYWDNDVPQRRGRANADSHYQENKVRQANMISESTHNNNIFDIQSIVKKVNDDDFQYEYEEAVKAYDKGLYLASSVTAAVALETALKLAFTRALSEEKLPRVYYILTLADGLKEAGLIDDRLHHRIKSVNELRRGVAHSKTGRVNEWDANQVIGAVKVIVDSLF